MSERIMNYNLAQENLFKLEIPNEPKFNYFLQAVELPSIMMSAVEIPNTNNQGFAPGNKVEYANLSCTFLLDEDFENYQFLHDWLRSFIDDRPWQDIVKDLKMTILTANKIPILEFNFIMCIPTMISSISFNTTTTENNQITFTTEFAYQYFRFSRII